MPPFRLSLYRENPDRSTLKNIRRPTVKVERRMKCNLCFIRYGCRIVTVAELGVPKEYFVPGCSVIMAVSLVFDRGSPARDVSVTEAEV